MGLPAERFATYEDLFDLPDTMIGQILHRQLDEPVSAPPFTEITFALSGLWE